MFPPTFCPTPVRKSVARHKNDLTAAAERDVCASCGTIVQNSGLYEVEKNDPVLRPLENDLDICGLHVSHCNLCSSCYNALIRNTISKYSAKNQVNVTLCHRYLYALGDLTPVEECLIARSHPLGVILKPRPGGRSSSVNYHTLRGHFIVIPQDPGPLLDILPSPQLRLYDLIKFFRIGKQRPLDTDLKPFLSVRKAKQIDDWSDDFIPRELRDSIVCLDEPDH
ncbi:hypothetical protein BDV23DRAFT_184211 [Aspergillus alliaceus]|uniref:DUF6570 domain-containing protein n=1 Tax=Petromyces alliaceus TaxID=209559 RepID=A0A5N7C7B9_PETAA|nr:hypothetical protein BDV23DRAFT_184211 [Aspergillus alliaceus]